MYKRSKQHDSLRNGLKPHIYLTTPGYLPADIHPLVAQDREALYVTMEGPAKLFAALALRFAGAGDSVIN